MRIHIHANCQAVPIAGMLAEVYPDWEISFFEVHAQPIVDQIDRYYESVSTADIVLSQPVHNGFRERDDLSLGWIKANVRSRDALIVFPSLHFAAHQPGWVANPFPGIDLLAAHLLATGLQPEAALQQLLSPDLLADSDVEREIELATAETKRREIDDGVDVKISPFLDEHSDKRLLFHINNHPMRETAVFITNRILERMGLPRRVPRQGHDYQAYPHIPPLPAITRFLAARGGMAPDPEYYETVRLPAMPEVPMNSYYRQMIEQLASVPSEDLFSMIAQRWPTVQFLRRLAANKNAIPCIERWLN